MSNDLGLGSNFYRVF
jgi:hypothetical protein